MLNNQVELAQRLAEQRHARQGRHGAADGGEKLAKDVAVQGAHAGGRWGSKGCGLKPLLTAFSVNYKPAFGGAKENRTVRIISRPFRRPGKGKRPPPPMRRACAASERISVANVTNPPQKTLLYAAEKGHRRRTKPETPP
ncbi:MAG: hypothetical protein WDN06_19190 [Asticcacaulis sp.]